MIDGIGDTQINSIKSFFKNSTNLKFIYELEKANLIYTSVTISSANP